jgi:hypothetical protein
MATLWVAAGAHCLLEVLPGLEFLSCCQHPEADSSPGHHEKDCDSDGCAAIESGLYKAEKTQAAPPKPSLELVAWLLAAPQAAPAKTVSLTVLCSSSPPELHRIWQFSQRTARPPRAPSFAS